MSQDKIINLIQQFGQPILDNNNSSAVIAPWRYSDPLVCPDLELIIKESIKYNLRIRITTNAVSLTREKVNLLEKYINHLAPIYVSIIGSTQAEVKKYMNIDLNKTLNKFKRLSKRQSPLLTLLRCRISQVGRSESDCKKATKLANNIKKLGIDCNVRQNWESNRLDANPTWKRDVKLKKNQHVIGCGLTSNKPLWQIDVMVDGDVVLCCDDATKEKTFGNVFEEGLLNVWNGPLKKEHELIYAKSWSKEKEKLICINCSRAILN